MSRVVAMNTNVHKDVSTMSESDLEAYEENLTERKSKSRKERIRNIRKLEWEVYKIENGVKEAV